MRGIHNPVMHENVKPKSGSIWSMYKRIFFQVRSQWPLLVVAGISILAVSLLEFVIPQLSQYTIDHLIPDKRYDALIWIALSVLGTAVLLALFNYMSGIAMATIGQNAVYQLRNQLYRHLQMLDVGFFDRNRTGDLMSRVTSDVGMLQQLVSSGMMSIVTDLFTFVAVAAYMMWMDWQLTLVVLATFPLMIVTTRFFTKRIRAAFKKIQESVAEVTNHLQDTLSSIRLMKSFSTEEYETERFAVRSRNNMSANIAAVKLRSVYEPIIDLLIFAGLAVVLILGAKGTMDGNLTVGTIVAFLAYLRLLQNPVRRFSRTLNTIQQSAAAYERIVEILETKPQVVEKADALELQQVQGDVEFHEVSFAYHNGVPVLKQFNFKLEAGKITAIVGSSGAGKSTITHLITRFYDPQQGTITIDGHPLPDISLTSLRKQMGIVSQDIVLLNGTIRENIVYGKPHASDEEVEAAARAAHAHEFIMSFPLGYESQIGERGVKLSGGQKQRLSIARAILKDPRLIILDEATSSLDTESEKAIQDALEHLLANRTSLVIAHRLSTIQRADRIYVLDKDGILEFGTHESLLAKQGKYKQLYDLQFPQKQVEIETVK
ncbi:Putative multidrug export ATP-binding/permease protein [Paenibacillus plantiphilus]|uniref:Multidrug export ATP-binding/permease protein n=1 Tax=Paenibacillus plantiphilus TaxID=2905650 RepID=A0ABM9C3Q7_9BACL|nr:ABC transporter ATP-binding protein [Paenibacillus plantiphilus]CAH1203505.1 Putative multidrug export ATP-binding/permease protein [Paenibacillus plantiphilus]